MDNHQVTAIIKAADGEWKTVVLFGALTGARLGDCVNMRWANVDFPKFNRDSFHSLGVNMAYS